MGTWVGEGREAGRLLGARGGALVALSRVAAILAVILVPLVLVLVVLLPLSILVLDRMQTQKRKGTMKNQEEVNLKNGVAFHLVSWLTC